MEDIFKKIGVLYCLMHISFSMIAYKSSIPIQIYQNDTGIDYINVNATTLTSNALSFCLQFNIKRFRSYMVSMSHPDMSRSFMFLKINSQTSWFGIGTGSHKKGEFSSGILKDYTKNSFEIWKIGVWHGFCVSYDDITGKIIAIQVICIEWIGFVHPTFQFLTLLMQKW